MRTIEEELYWDDSQSVVPVGSPKTTELPTIDAGANIRLSLTISGKVVARFRGAEKQALNLKTDPPLNTWLMEMW